MISRFFNYVEIKTKITSLFPFFMGIGFILYKGQSIKLVETIVFFLAMFLFDLTTTAINNYIDTKTNNKDLPYERKKALLIIYLMLAASTGLGLVLVILSDWIVLVLGGICFVSGVFYTYGPLPISRQPLGEIFSGVFYGFMIPLILFYINMPNGYYFNIAYTGQSIDLVLQIKPLIELVLLSVAPVMCTANIMLANNICDLERDLLVKRHTLPYYIGDKALGLFKWLYYATYPAVIGLVAMGSIHPINLLALLNVMVVRKNIKIFHEKQDKETTFLASIKNYIIIMGSLTILMWISILVR